MRVKFSWSNYLNFFMHPLLGAHPLALIRIFRRHKVKPTLHFLPKYLFIAAMSLLNLPLIWLEDIWLWLNRHRIAEPSPVFIIGHPRSGTTHLQQMLASDPRFYTPTLSQVLFPNYCNTFGLLLNLIISPFIPSRRPQDNVAVGLDTPQEEEFAIAGLSGISFINAFYFPRQFKEIIAESVLFEKPGDKERWQRAMLRFVRKISVNKKDRILLLKSPANMGRISAIREIFPQAKFIYVRRDPHPTLQSTFHLFETVLPLTSLQIIPPGDMIDKAFFMYECFLREFHKQAPTLGEESLLEVAHETFVAQTDPELRRIYRFIGAENQREAAQLPANSRYRKNTYKPLPAEILLRLHAVNQKLGPLPGESGKPHQVAV